MWRTWRPATGILISLLLIAITNTALTQTSGQREVDLLLVLAVDVSESINRREAWLQRFGHAEALTDPLVIAAIKGGRYGRIAIAYLEWAGPSEQRLVVDWTIVEDRENSEKLNKILTAEPISSGYWTSISAALETASRIVANAPFAAARRVIDLSSDGRNNAGKPLGPTRKRVLSQGITINGLPVLAMRRNFTWPPMPYLDHYFTDCVIDGPGAFSELVEGYDDVARVVRRKLIREIAGPLTPAGQVILAASAAARPRIRCAEDPATPGNTDGKL